MAELNNEPQISQESNAEPNQEAVETDKKKTGTREGQKQDSFWGEESLVKEFQEYVKEHGFVKTEVYEGLIQRWLDKQKNGIDTGEYKQSSLDFETLLVQIQRMYDESLGARSALVKAHKEQMETLNAARLAAEEDTRKEKAEREKLEKLLAESEAARDDAVKLKEEYKTTYHDWKRRAEEYQEAKVRAEKMEAAIQKMDGDMLKTQTALDKASNERDSLAAQVQSLETTLEKEKAARVSDAAAAEKRQEEAVNTALESAKLDLRAAVAEQREKDADRLEQERQEHANMIAAMQEKVDLARQKQGEAETERNAAVKLQTEAEAARDSAIRDLQMAREALAAAEVRIRQMENES